MVRLCKDCRWYIKEGSCLAPQNRVPIKSTNLIDGTPQPYPSNYGLRWLTYTMLRSKGWLGARLYQQCGKEGRWWVHNPLPH